MLNTCKSDRSHLPKVFGRSCHYYESYWSDYVFAVPLTHLLYFFLLLSKAIEELCPDDEEEFCNEKSKTPGEGPKEGFR